MSSSTKSLTRRIALLGAASMLALASVAPAAVFAAGSIWTTREACNDPNPQNENQYETGDHVSIRGSGFASGQTGSWEIRGNPGQSSTDPDQVVASGSVTADGAGGFCVDAYTIAVGDDGTYKFTVFIGIAGVEKHDNYTVDEVIQPTPTPTPTPTPGATPTPTPTGGATLPPTDRVSGTSGSADSLGLVLMALAGVLASVMVLTPARARRR